jgi:S1-C subfamily serine protease
MPLFLTLLLSLSFLTGCTTPPLDEASSTQIDNILRDQVRFVVVADKLEKVDYRNGNLSFRAEKQLTTFGTAVALTSDGYVLTAAHVVQGSFADPWLSSWVIEFKDRDVQFHKAELIWQAPGGDLALLKVSVTNAPHFNWSASGKLPKGTPVIQGGARSMRARGKITFEANLDQENEPFTTIYHSTRVRKGDSGGPLMNELGELIGINTLHIFLRVGFPGLMVNGGAVTRPNVPLLNDVIEAHRTQTTSAKVARAIK